MCLAIYLLDASVFVVLLPGDLLWSISELSAHKCDVDLNAIVKSPLLVSIAIMTLVSL